MCQACKRKTCLKALKPCKRIEKLLPKIQDGRLSGENSLNLMDEVFSRETNGDISDLKKLRKQRHSPPRIDY